MIYDDKDGYMILSTGRKVSALLNIIGIGRTGSDFIYAGYDNHVCVDGSEDEEDDPAWTLGERAEVADEMIDRWQRFKSPQPKEQQAALQPPQEAE